MDKRDAIIKESYEKIFGTQKYEKSNLYHTYKQVTDLAMSEYALEVSKEKDKKIEKLEEGIRWALRNPQSVFVFNELRNLLDEKALSKL